MRNEQRALIIPDSAEMQKVRSRLMEVGMPKEQAIKELSFAAQVVNKNPLLQKCNSASIMASIINIGNVGLTLNPAAQEAYLVPRYNGKAGSYEAVLQPGYRGLVKLIVQQGTVTNITANVVHENDEFILDLADDTKPITHRPVLVAKNRGEFIGAYALATLTNGKRQPEWVDADMVYKIRETSESWKREATRKWSPWELWFDEMARKTAVRRLTKYLPRRSTGSPGQQAMDFAIQLDNADSEVTFEQIGFISNLVRTANITPEQVERIEYEMHTYTYDQASQCIKWLKENQAEPMDPRKQFKERNGK